MSRSQANAREISRELSGAVEHAGERHDLPPPRKVGLNGGAVALIDEADAPRVMAFRWHVRTTRGPGLRRQYAACNVTGLDGKRTTMLLHRFITNAPADQDIDHRNHDGLDCRRENMRLCSRRENARNARKAAMPTTSNSKGVDFHKNSGKWRARITVGSDPGTGRKQIRYLGHFNTETEAAAAYDSAARELFGEFAFTNAQVAS